MSGGNNSQSISHPPPHKKHHGGGGGIWKKKFQVEAIYKITGLSYLSQSIAKKYHPFPKSGYTWKTEHWALFLLVSQWNSTEKTPFVKNITNSFNLIEKQTNVDTVTLVFISLNLFPIHLYKQKSLVFRIGNWCVVVDHNHRLDFYIASFLHWNKIIRTVGLYRQTGWKGHATVRH